MWGIIPVVIALVLIYFLEQRGIERDNAKKEVQLLTAKNEELTRRNIELSNLKCDTEGKTLRDAFLLLCRAKDVSIPEGYTLEQIASAFVNRSGVMLVCDVNDLDPQKTEYYIRVCVRYIRNSKAIRKFLEDNDIIFDEAYSFDMIFAHVFSLRVDSKSFEEAIRREIASVPHAFIRNTKNT